MKIGTYSYGKPEVLKFGTDGELIIGNFCSIASKVTILLGGEHEQNISTFPFFAFFPEVVAYNTGKTKGDVNIGNDVWIGHRVTILSGVTVNDGAIIGAGTLISKDVPAYAVIIGNPQQILRYRFTNEQIEKLLKIKWWNFSQEKIIEAIPYLTGKNIDEFIKKYEN